MLVIVTENQLLPPQQVCNACLLANQDGLPRWQQGKLGCGVKSNTPTESCGRSPLSATIHRCQMGFELADING
ncbi:MAG: hypothetical protein AAGG51_10375 [Cyanobacteria bacterium P01_G01_bin.54]